MLSLDWGVCSRTDLLARIYWLITSGHRTGFDAERARWVSTSLAEAERHELWDTADSSSDAAKTLWRLERMLNNEPGHPKRGLRRLGSGPCRHADTLRIRDGLDD